MRWPTIIEIPLGKALVAVEKDALGCEDCFFRNAYRCFEKMACRSSYRTDGKDVIFKLIDINQNTGGDDGTDWPGGSDSGNSGNWDRDSENREGKQGFSQKQEKQMRETIVRDSETPYVYGKVFPSKKQAARYMWRSRAVVAAGYLLAAVFTGLWLYERWIG